MRSGLLLSLLIFLTACVSDQSAARQNSYTTIYQPPLTAGGTGRILRIPVASDAGACGSVSPGYSYVFEAPEGRKMALRRQVFEVFTQGEKTRQELMDARPPSNSQNFVNYYLLVDESWTDSFSLLANVGNRSGTHQRYSVSDADCWAANGDQMAQFMLGFEYLRRYFKSDRGDEDDALEYLEQAMKFFELSAEMPREEEVCATKETCPTDTLTLFPAGVPQAHWVLYNWALKSEAEGLGLPLENAETYLRNAVRAGVAPAYHVYYQVSRRPEHPL